MFWFVVVPLFLLICFVLLLVIGYTPVESGEVYSLKRFGKFRRALKPGWNFIIPFLDKVERHSTQPIQREFPAEPENVDRENDPPLPGKVKPFRIVHKGMEEAIYYVKRDPLTKLDPKDPLSAYDKKHFGELPKKVRDSMAADPTHAPLTSEIPVVVEWYLVDDHTNVERYLNNVDSSRLPREEEIARRMSDATARAVQELLGSVTLGHATEMFPVFNAVMKLRMEALVGEIPDLLSGEIDRPWGVHISTAYMKEPDLGRTVNKARADAAAAVSRRQDQILASQAEAQTIKNTADATAHQIKVTADADAHRIKTIGEAEKAREIAEGEGKAGHVNAMAEAIMKPGGLEAARLNVAESALTADGRTVYIPTDLAALGGVLTMAQEMAKASAPPEAPTAPSV